MDTRTEHLIELSRLAARYELRAELATFLAHVKASESVTREEVYEAFLQIYLFAGFPAGLEAMRALHKLWPGQHTSPEDVSHEEIVERGFALYQRIYGSKAEIVKSEVLKLCPDLAERALVEGYGKTIARPGLDIRTRELCIVAVLATLGWDRQLFSHMMGALNVGAPREDIHKAVELATHSDAGKRERALSLLARLS